jgi:hypothetical protein
MFGEGRYYGHKNTKHLSLHSICSRQVSDYLRYVGYVELVYVLASILDTQYGRLITHQMPIQDPPCTVYGLKAISYQRGELLRKFFRENTALAFAHANVGHNKT